MKSLEEQATRFPIVLLVTVVIVLDILVWVIAPKEFAVLFTGLAIVCLIFGAFASKWSARRLVYPINNLLPVVDDQGKLKIEGSNGGNGSNKAEPPKELAQLSAAIGQIVEKQQQDLEARQTLERVRSEFLGNVSHELRTPIFAVQGFIETLLDGAIDDPQVNRDFLERARVQAERLNSLLNDLIDISRIESGEMRMSFRTFDVLAFLREFTSEMQDAAKAKKIDLYFRSNLLPQHGIDVYADKERIKQVLINLVDNAIKYSETGNAIKVELINNEPNDQSATIRVVDNGVGIAPEHLSRLFERFYRVDKGRARSSPGGTGLGLAIVKHIVEAHRSRISVISEQGKGSTFQFMLHKRPFQHRFSETR